MTRQERKIFPSGHCIDHYSIKRLVGQGGYGDIYEAYDKDKGKDVAMKIEFNNSKKKALAREYSIMQILKFTYFPEFVEYKETPELKYLCMELCGPSISTIRKALPSRTLEPSTILRVSIEMLRAIKAFHEAGFLNRDIKPSNFLLRPSRKYPICLIDYGLSCPISYEQDDPPRSRDHPRFVGTSKYASVRAHIGDELGPRDDLYSWFISIVELWIGYLPWSQTNDKRAIYEMKMHTDIAKFIEPMPKAMFSVYKLIRRLKTHDTPNYELLMSFIVEAMKEVGASWDDPYQWETMDISHISALPSLDPPPGDTPNIPTNLPEPVIPPMEFKPFTRDGMLNHDRRKMVAYRKVPRPFQPM